MVFGYWSSVDTNITLDTVPQTESVHDGRKCMQESTRCPKIHEKGKVHPRTGTETLYRPYGPQGGGGGRGIALPFHDHGTTGK
jgi:hypothetical protein